jgi:Tfp pilus assembly pilus retraction ATPase PilT/CheY-like chemotaxis protein
VPQDGRTRLQVEGTLRDARVSTLPNIHGEKVVIRLLARADSVPPIAKIGMTSAQLEALLGTMVAPQGLVLITGPTGSGKTSTLYSALQQVKTPDRNIVTLEDPVEMQVAGITQVQINERTGLTFARGLRSVLRQDPDVVLVGEVRDHETAKLALEASLTGHLVLTTLHTNSAPAAMTRLMDMGVEPYLVASSLSLVVAQRLVRRVCQACAAPYLPSARVRQLLGLTSAQLEQATPRRGAGCGECGDTGYRGRLGVFETLPVTRSIRDVLMSSPTEAAVAAAAHDAGMRTLRSDAVAKADAGLTTYEEVLRISHIDSVSELDGAPVDYLEDRPPRVLVVDDEPAVRDFVADTLADVAIVDTVGTAGEALDRSGTTRYDGFVIDNRLPDLSGVELIRLLRSEVTTASVPVLMLTGDETSELESTARLAGADDYLGKPVESAELERRVRALVHQNEIGNG